MLLNRDAVVAAVEVDERPAAEAENLREESFFIVYGLCPAHRNVWPAIRLNIVKKKKKKKKKVELLQHNKAQSSNKAVNEQDKAIGCSQKIEI